MAKFLVHKLHIWKILVVLTSILGLLTLGGFFGRLWWILDTMSHFRLQYCIILATFTILFVIWEKYRQAVLAGVFACFNFFLIVPFILATQITQATSPTIKILNINLYVANTDYQKAFSLIDESDADLIVLEEFDKTWRRELKDISKKYPFSIVSSWKNGWGIGVFSRTPFIKTETGPIGSSPIPYVLGKINLVNQQFTLIGTHLQDPMTDVRTDVRNRQLTSLSKLVQKTEGPVIVLADLNITPWSPYFKDFLKQAGLKNSRHGLGIKPTWPTHFFPLLIPIDHCLASQEINVQSLRTGPNIGSDHYPVIVEFSIPETTS